MTENGAAASTYEEIDLEVEEGVATIYLNRPERLNAATVRLIEEFLDALDRTDGDDEVGAVIVTGRGRAFCAGADLGGGEDTFERGEEEFEMARHQDLGGVIARRIFDSTKPIIAAINGPAVGLGATITLPMDIRMAAAGARIGFVFTRRGLVPEASSSWFLPRIVGISRALEWIYSGRLIEADEAESSGLVRSVHPEEELLTAAHQLARELSANSSVATAVSRRMLWQMLAGDPVLAHELDSEALHVLGGGADVREGVNAYLEKREARFPMRVPGDLPPFFDRWKRERGALGTSTPGTGAPVDGAA